MKKSTNEMTDTLWFADCVVCSEYIPITAQAFDRGPVCPVCGAVYAPLYLDLLREGDDVLENNSARQTPTTEV